MFHDRDTVVSEAVSTSFVQSRRDVRTAKDQIERHCVLVALEPVDEVRKDLACLFGCAALPAKRNASAGTADEQLNMKTMLLEELRLLALGLSERN